MNREDIVDYYIFIRLWTSNPEDEDPSKPFYPYHTPIEGGGMKWKLTREFDQAAVFRSAKIAIRIVKNIPVTKSRLEQGWGYEIVKITEECLESNINFEDIEEAA